MLKILHKLRNKDILNIVLVCFFQNCLTAQNFEWAKSFGMKNTSDNVVATWIEDDSFTTSILTISNNILNPNSDTLYFDTFYSIIPGDTKTS